MHVSANKNDGKSFDYFNDSYDKGCVNSHDFILGKTSNGATQFSLYKNNKNPGLKLFADYIKTIKKF